MNSLSSDLIALAATLTMYLGVFLLPSTAWGLLLIAAGGLVMLILLVRIFLERQ